MGKDICLDFIFKTNIMSEIETVELYNGDTVEKTDSIVEASDGLLVDRDDLGEDYVIVYCDGVFHIDDVTYCSNIDSYAENDDSNVYYLECIGEYYYGDDSVVYCENDGEYYPADDYREYDIVRIYEGEYYHIDYTCYCEYEDEYHHENDCNYCEHCEIYYHDSNDDCPDCGGTTDGYNGYHSYGYKDFTNNETKYRIGFEIEKSEAHSDVESLKEKGWGCELDSSCGYEHITPVLDIDKAVDFILESPELIELQANNQCGGHITVSVKDKQASEVYDGLNGYRPLLWALYPKRALNNYCKKNGYYKQKYSDIHLKGSTVEMRIFPAVRNKTNVRFRVALVKYFLENPAMTSIEAIDLINTKEFFSILDIAYKSLQSKSTIVNRILDTYKAPSKTKKLEIAYELCERLEK